MAELTTTLEFSITNTTDESISVVDARKLGFNIGNYFQIDDEIFEIRTIVTSNTLYVKRGLLGSTRSTHTAGALVRRISKVEEPIGTITPGDVYGIIEYPPVINESFSSPDTENLPINPETYFAPDSNDGSLDPFPPTLISFNSSEYEVARTHGTLGDPKDVGSFAVGKLAVIGPQDEPSNFVSVDVSVEIASNISKNETTENTITEYTSFYSRPNLWRSGGLYDVDTFDNAFHFRVLPIQQDVLETTQTILTGITATFYGSEKTRVYLSNLTGVDLNHFLVQSTYYSSNVGNRARIIGVGENYVDLNTEHSFVGISTITTASVVDIKTSNVETEFGYYFDGPSVNFNLLIDWSYGFYYGDSNALKNCSQPTHRRWGVFIETSPWNPCDPNSECTGSDPIETNQTWNFFEDLTLYGDYRSIGILDEFHPEPLVQILRPKHGKRGLYVKDTVGIGTTTDRRIQLYVDYTNNPCIDKTHAIVAIGPVQITGNTNIKGNVEITNNTNILGNVGIGTTNATQKLDVIGNGNFSGTVSAIGNVTSNDGLHILSNKKNLPFDMVHPTKAGWRLRHVCLEGPEIGVYVHGKGKGKTIEMPDYWRGLVRVETITVQLTPVGGPYILYVEKIEDNKVYVGSNVDFDVEYNYLLHASRFDDDLIVEYEGKSHEDYPGGNEGYSFSFENDNMERIVKEVVRERLEKIEQSKSGLT